MKKLTIIIIALLLVGCMTPRRINKFKATYCKDSVSVQIKESIVKIPVLYADSSMLSIWLTCDSLQNVYWTEREYYRGEWTSIKSKLENNKLTVIAKTYIHDTVFVTVHDTIKFQQAVVHVPYPKKKKDIILEWLGTIFIWEKSIILILLILYFAFKKYFVAFKNKIKRFTE